jgi:hypothetical protein
LRFVRTAVKNRRAMKNYDFSKNFRVRYDQAVKAYAEGKRSADALFANDDKAFLAANGLTAQHLYDYAEDHNNHEGEPGFELALSIELVRRDYFLNAQHGKPSGSTLDEARLPAKTDAILGIEWLPRLIPKAKAKLRGELPASLMYCCGGDRRFFKRHDIHAAEFLSLIWRHFDNERAIIDWVYQRSAAVSQPAEALR